MKKKMLTGSSSFFVAVLLFAACHKSGSSPTPPPSSPSLQGNWTMNKYIVTNFDTAGGMTPLPNDTIYPTHSEYKIFTKDSVYGENWENFVYAFTHPDSFYNTQTKEFFD